MRYEIDTVLAGARAERLDQRELTRDRLDRLLQAKATNTDTAVAKRGELVRELRTLSDMVEEGLPPFDKPLLFDDGSELNTRVRAVLKGLPSKIEQRRLDREVKEARDQHAAPQLEGFLESYLRAAQAAGETHISTNALKEAGISPRETMDLVAKGQQARFGSNA